MRPQPDGRIVVQLGDNTALVLGAATGRVWGRPRTSILVATLDVGIRPGNPPAVAWACWQDTPLDLDAEEDEEE